MADQYGRSMTTPRSPYPPDHPRGSRTGSWSSVDDSTSSRLSTSSASDPQKARNMNKAIKELAGMYMYMLLLLVYLLSHCTTAVCRLVTSRLYC